MSYRLGVDVGGTFTDLLLINEATGETHTAKVPSTPEDSSLGVLNGIARVCDETKIDPTHITRVMHGTTVATNAVLTGKGAKVGLVTTSGYEDTLQVARSFCPGGLGGWVSFVKKTHDQMFEEIGRIVAALAEVPEDERPVFEVGLSTAFGCTIEGIVPEDTVVSIAEGVIALGADEVCLSDTTGYANPTQVKNLTGRIRSSIGRERMSGIHLHNTRGQGLANVMAALDAGITTIDSSLGGIGGCPFAPGASGNIVTEDLVYLLESMGLHTGIDIEKLLSVRKYVQKTLSEEKMYGFVPEAGLPLGFTYAAERG